MLVSMSGLPSPSSKVERFQTRIARGARVVSAGFFAERFDHEARVALNQRKQNPSRPRGLAAPLLPLPKRPGRHAQKSAEVFLRVGPPVARTRRVQPNAATSISSGIFAPLICLWLATLVPPSMLTRCAI